MKAFSMYVRPLQIYKVTFKDKELKDVYFKASNFNIVCDTLEEFHGARLTREMMEDLVPDLGEMLRDGGNPAVQNKIDQYVNYRIFFIGYTKELPKMKNDFHQINEDEIPEELRDHPYYMKEVTFI